jgi:hypothetical protein
MATTAVAAKKKSPGGDKSHRSPSSKDSKNRHRASPEMAKKDGHQHTARPVRHDPGSDEDERVIHGYNDRRTQSHRPRRPHPDTLAYLRSLPLDLDTSERQVSDFVRRIRCQHRDEDRRGQRDEEPPEGTAQLADSEQAAEFPSILGAALSALDEVRNEAASLACDEAGSECLEALARVACPHSEIAARLLLSSLVDYASHLAFHRYGSHVLQTVLEASATRSGGHDDDEGVDEEEESGVVSDLAHHEGSPLLATFLDGSLPSLVDLVAALHSALLPSVPDLCAHPCGAPVLRTLVCVLGGAKVVEVRRGSLLTSHRMHRGKPKAKKKNKKEGVDPHAEVLGPNRTASHGNPELTMDSRSRLLAARGKDQQVLCSCLDELAARFTGGTDDVLQPGDLQELACHASAGPLLATLLRVLAWDRQHVSMDAPFQLGSPAHRLAKRLLCWKTDATGDDKQQQPWAGDVIYQLAGDAVGSRVLETVLWVAHDDFYALLLRAGGFLSTATLQEYVEHDVGNYVVQAALSTLRSPSQASEVLSTLSPAIRSGLAINLSRRRRGVVWRAIEAAATHRVQQREIIQDIVHGFDRLRSSSSSPSSSNVAPTALKRIRSLKECVVMLLCIKLPETNGGRLGLDAPGAHCVSSLLGFPPELCQDVLKGVLRLSSPELEALAKDGLGSRCVWDAILDRSRVQRDAGGFVAAAKQLAVKLRGRWVALASDRIGQHAVRKLFASLPDIESRKQLVLELSSAMSRLNGSAMGRSTMEACFVHEYVTNGEKAWSAQVKKMLNKVDLLNEIVEEANPGNELSGATVQPKTARKRGVERDVRDSRKKRREKEGTMSVASIMQILTIPPAKTTK